MKKILLLLLLLITLLCCAACGDKEPAPAENGDAPAAGQDDQPVLLEVGVVVNAEIVNIRQQANTESRILDTVRRGDLFQVLEQGITGDDGLIWARLNYRGANAYISEDYLYVSEWSEDAPVTIGIVGGSEAPVNIRSAADPTSFVLYNANRGEQMIVTKQLVNSEWHQVFNPDTPAFINQQYLTLSETTIKEALFE